MPFAMGTSVCNCPQGLLCRGAVCPPVPQPQSQDRCPLNLVQVCSALHQRYAEFSQELVPAIAVNLTPQAGEQWRL